ncbi:MAG: adenylate/guanylate cyclase domain-containing protein [Gallionellaceae bacterium]|nr:adenylate/guanylate cyclase domain-containing protein [Gallionellaceae bacterium]
MTSPPAHAASICATSLEQVLWPELHKQLERALVRLGQQQLSPPLMLLLRDTLDHAIKAMHREVFRLLAQSEFGMEVGGDEEALLDELYAAETGEHGAENIARYCREHDWHVSLDFHDADEDIVSLACPVAWDVSRCHTAPLADALGFQWHELPVHTGTLLVLRRHERDAMPAQAGVLLDDADSRNAFLQLCERLGYGSMSFAGSGEVLTLSRSMLACTRQPVDESSTAAVCAAIPFNFLRDIVWGMTLENPDGTFENYRTRMLLPGAGNLSILFNVSGYRDEQSVVHTLWQPVSLDEGGAATLTEGSMLNEARIHKITRNYVPQLVAEKAREAVSLCRDTLANEECTVAVLFCDIVGFTSYVESNASSESIINTLNAILRRVSSSVRRHNGFIDKFMGDSVMAIFHDPSDALHAAIDMQKHAADINRLRSRAGQDMLRLRIGIHWGEVVIGNVGTEERLDWTAIGDVVNTASRIEKNCDPGAILVSRALMDVIGTARHPEFDFGELFTIQVKGKQDKLSVCHVSGQEP